MSLPKWARSRYQLKKHLRKRFSKAFVDEFVRQLDEYEEELLREAVEGDSDPEYGEPIGLLSEFFEQESIGGEKHE